VPPNEAAAQYLSYSTVSYPNGALADAFDRPPSGAARDCMSGRKGEALQIRRSQSLAALNVSCRPVAAMIAIHPKPASAVARNQPDGEQWTAVAIAAIAAAVATIAAGILTAVTPTISAGIATAITTMTTAEATAGMESAAAAMEAATAAVEAATAAVEAATTTAAAVAHPRFGRGDDSAR
jgi:hypothetical protein